MLYLFEFRVTRHHDTIVTKRRNEDKTIGVSNAVKGLVL